MLRVHRPRFRGCVSEEAGVERLDIVEHALRLDELRMPQQCRVGAWQIGVRFSNIDSNNRGINGGMLDDLTVGLNWILNNNTKFPWNYEWSRRYGLASADNGNFNAFGMRMITSGLPIPQVSANWRGGGKSASSPLGVPRAIHSSRIFRCSGERLRSLDHLPWLGSAYHGGIRPSSSTSAMVADQALAWE